MSTPAPRPALRKAPDAHVHPAAPGSTTHRLGHAAPPEPAGAAPSTTRSVTPEVPSAPDVTPTRTGLSGPPKGNTSDSLRHGRKAARRARSAPPEKMVELTVKIPKSLRKQLRESAKAAHQEPDEIVASLLRAWLHG